MALSMKKVNEKNNADKEIARMIEAEERDNSSTSAIQALEALVEPVSENAASEVEPAGEQTAVKERTPRKKETKKRSRPKGTTKPIEEKRVQISMTLAYPTIKKLESFDKGFRKLLNRYIDKNIDMIIKELEKL